MTRIKKRQEKAYWRKLNDILDDVYAKADEAGLNNRELAERSGLHVNTIQRIDNRRVKYPRLQTVYLLARAVGMTIDVSLIEERIRV